MDTTASDRSALIRLASSLPKGSEERKAILASLPKTSAKADAAKPGDILSPATARGFAVGGPVFYEVVGTYKRGKGFELQPLQGVEVAGPKARMLKPGKPILKKSFGDVGKWDRIYVGFGQFGDKVYRFPVPFQGKDEDWDIAIRKKWVVPLAAPRLDPEVERFITELKDLSDRLDSVMAKAGPAQTAEIAVLARIFGKVKHPGSFR